MPASKRKAGHVSCPVVQEKSVNEEKPIKVSFPGERVVSAASGGRYSLRQFKDPRLGTALSTKKAFFAHYGIKDDPPGISEDESEDVPERLSHITLTKGEKLIVVKRINNSAILPPIIYDKKPRTYVKPSEAEMERRKKRSERYWKKSFKHSIDNEAQYLKESDCSCAKEAVKFYNEKHSTDYEVVETLGSYCGLEIGFWLHCNFRARCKSDNDHGRRSSPKLFFAELYCKGGELIAKVCKMLDAPGKRPDTVRGCKMCRGQLWHPINGFEAGM